MNKVRIYAIMLLVMVLSSVAAMGAQLSPMVTDTGKLSLSVDGLGITGSSGIIQVEKPAGATVKGAYFAAASTGFSSYTIPNGGITLEGTGVTWSTTIVSSIFSRNHWADVTSIIKPVVDAAPAGRVDIDVVESSSGSIDGSILAVIFDDPSQTHDNTIILFFGAQNVAGDTFNLGLSEPINTAEAGFALDMGLGISFGYQPAGQYSRVDVNTVRLTTSAGGQDDGAGANGALITVGGLDDLNTNPVDPFATDGAGPRSDDELYNLIPFVKNGDTTIDVYTQNPSTDDNIFFASLYLGATAAIVGEGIVLGPTDATNMIGTPHTVTATVQDTNGNPIVGKNVTFNITSGPNAGTIATAVTDSDGKAQFIYISNLLGTDTIVASYLNSQDERTYSNEVSKLWVEELEPTVCGNDVLEQNEQCDDGNTNDNDGCSSVCRFEQEEPPVEVPEFTTIGAGIALLGASLAIAMRRKRK